MRRQQADGIAEAKYRAYVERIVARLKSLPGEDADRLVEQTCREVILSCPEPELNMLWFGADAIWGHHDDSPGSRADLEEGVLQELLERVRYAAGDADPDGSEKEEPAAVAAGFRFDDDELVFLSKVARGLAHLAVQPGLAPAEAKAVRRAVAALRRLPAWTPGVGVRIEVVQRMGGQGFSETYRYAIALDRERIEIRSSGTQSGPAAGSESFTLESLQWYANGQAAHNGNRDTWLERLAYALARDYTLNVTDESGGKCAKA
jgi:hypothetical protein